MHVGQRALRAEMVVGEEEEEEEEEEKDSKRW